MSEKSPERVILLAGTLIDGTGAEPHSNVALVIQRGRIRFIGDASEVVRQRDDVVLDHHDAFLIPGLVDAHVHLVFGALPTHAEAIDLLSNSSDLSLFRLALKHAQQALAAGVTTMRDCGDKNFVTVALRDLIAEGRIVGPRLAVSGPPITTPGGHLCFTGIEAKGEAALRAAVNRLADARVDHVKVVATGGMMTPGSNNRLPQYSEGELRAIVAEAHGRGLPVTAHLGATEGIRRAVQAGVDDLEHCEFLAESPEEDPDFDSELVARIARERRHWGNTIPGIFRTLLRNEKGPVSESQLKAWAAVFRRVYDAGVPMMICSDAGVRFTFFDRFWESLAVAVKFMGISEMVAIESATRIPAQALRMDRDIGTLELGKAADILILGSDPTKDISALASVRDVLKDGVSVRRWLPET